MNLVWIIVKSKWGSEFQSWHRDFFLDPKIIKTIVVTLGAMKRSDVPGEVFSGCASEDSDDEQLKSPPEVIGELLKSPHELLGALDKTLVDPGKQYQSTTPQVIVAIGEGKTEETVEGNTEETVKLKTPPGILGKLEETPVGRKTEETAILEGKTEETVDGRLEDCE